MNGPRVTSVPARERQAGFTLIELLVVVAVLAVLAGIVVFAVGTATSDSKASACAADRRTLQRALEAYKVRSGAYPSSLTSLAGSDEHLRDNGTVTALAKTGEGYTLTYDGAGGLSDCAAAIAAGGSSGSTTGGGGGATTGGPVATTMTAAVTAGATSFSGNGSNRIWAVTMTVAVTDNLGAAVVGASATAGWSFTFDGNAQNRGTGSQQTSCTTGGNGRCSLVGQGFESNVKTAVATVSSVGGGLTWSQQGSASDSASRPF